MALTLRRVWWRAARLEVKARRAARVWLHTSAPRGSRRVCGRRVVGVTLAGGAGVLVRRITGSTAPRVSRKVRGLAVDTWAAAGRAISAREQAARATVAARGALLAFRARAARSWDTAARGLRRGFMQ